MYGELRVPKTVRLTGLALCHVTLPPYGETKDTPGEQGHYHRRMTEIYCFTRGSGQLLLNGHWHAVHSGMAAVVPPMVMHTAAANGEGMEFVVWSCPAFISDDSFDLFSYPPEFSHHDPAWVRESYVATSQRPVELNPLFALADYTVACARLEPGAHIPPHRHARDEEACFIVDGSAEVTLGRRTIFLEKGALISISPGAEHGIIAGPRGVRYYVAATPPVVECGV